MPLSIQLYSARKFPPVETQLAAIHANGFEYVETFGLLHDDAADTRRRLDARGLAAKSAHIGLETIETQPERTLEIARQLGVEIVVAPYLTPPERPTSTEGWNDLGARLAQISARLAAEGHGFAWHNHDFEFVALPDGSFPIEHILTDSVQWEADIAWIVRAKADPKPWIARYGATMPLVHVKDIAPAGENVNEDGWADVGTGVVDWAA